MSTARLYRYVQVGDVPVGALAWRPVRHRRTVADMSERTDPAAAGVEPDDVEKTDPTPEQEAREAAEAQNDNAYNDPVGGMPIA